MMTAHRQFRIALTGLFAALAFVLGRLPHPANVECVTFAVFAAGYVGGALVGTASGAILALLQLVFGGGGNLLLASAQLVGFASAGACGSLFSRKVPPPLVLATTGGCLTVWYQLLVNLSLVPGSGLSVAQVFAAGGWFAALHVVNNVVVFEAGRLLLLALESHPAFVAWRKSLGFPGLKPV